MRDRVANLSLDALNRHTHVQDLIPQFRLREDLRGPLLHLRRRLGEGPRDGHVERVVPVAALGRVQRRLPELLHQRVAAPQELRELRVLRRRYGGRAP